MIDDEECHEEKIDDSGFRELQVLLLINALMIELSERKKKHVQKKPAISQVIPGSEKHLNTTRGGGEGDTEKRFLTLNEKFPVPRAARRAPGCANTRSFL